MSTIEVWAEVAARRRELADRVESLEPNSWDAESWCEGWRVRDVLGHLVHLAEATQVSMARDIARAGGRPDRALSRIAHQLGDSPVAELADRLRAAAGGRFHVFGTPASVALGEVVVHSADALRPVGAELEAPVADAVAVLGLYRRIGRVAFHSAPVRGRRLVATDANWNSGKGPEVRGRATDLLLLLANRRQVVPLLEGPGLVGL
jgi:uncharacterized protein (TIGR03083 family)